MTKTMDANHFTHFTGYMKFTSMSLCIFYSIIWLNLGLIHLYHLPIEGHEHVIYFIARTLIDFERKYGVIERDILALIYACKKLHHYLLPRPFKIYISYNPLRYLLSKPNIKGFMGYWILLL